MLVGSLGGMSGDTRLPLWQVGMENLEIGYREKGNTVPTAVTFGMCPGLYGG